MNGNEEKTIPELIRDLATELPRLARQEIQLARSEAMAKVSEIGRGLGYLGAGAVILLLAIILLAEVPVTILGGRMQDWLAALIVGAIITAIGAGLLLSGRSRMARIDPVPRRTVASVQADADVMKERV